MSAAIQFSHMGIHCFDVEAMRGFYTRVMGMRVTDEGVAPINGRETGLVFLSTDPREHH